MQHPNHKLVGYLEESLTAAERAETERHLAACPECRAELAALGAAGRALQSAGAEVQRPVFDPAMWSRVREQVGGRPGRSPFSLRWVAASGGLAVTAVAALLVYVNGMHIEPLKGQAAMEEAPKPQARAVVPPAAPPTSKATAPSAAPRPAAPRPSVQKKPAVSADGPELVVLSPGPLPGAGKGVTTTVVGGGAVYGSTGSAGTGPADERAAALEKKADSALSMSTGSSAASGAPAPPPAVAPSVELRPGGPGDAALARAADKAGAEVAPPTASPPAARGGRDEGKRKDAPSALQNSKLDEGGAQGVAPRAQRYLTQADIARRNNQRPVEAANLNNAINAGLAGEDLRTARLRLGDVFLQQGDATRALVEFREANKVRPGVDTLNRIAVASERTGDPKSAREAYEQALQFDPANAEARAGLERVANAG